MRVRPAGQVSTLLQTPPQSPSDACPPPPFCATLPSAQSAYRAVQGDPAGWVGVARDLAVRTAIVYTGIYVYDRVTKQKDPHRFARALAGTAAIELFVLGWTWATLPRPASAP